MKLNMNGKYEFSKESALFLGRPYELLIELNSYWVRLVVRNASEPLVITFEAAGDPNIRPNKKRLGWGETALTSMGFNVVSVLVKHVNWYQDGELRELFKELRSSGFFDDFPNVITYGGSMGGYGAAAISGDVLADKVLLINPISTLSTRLAPWEKRFKQFRDLYDWNRPESDAASLLNSKSKTYIAVDPFFEPDYRHAQRFSEKCEVCILRCPFLGHRLPVWLRTLGLLKYLIQTVADDSLNKHFFYKEMRGRRSLKRYYDMASKHQRVKESALFYETVKRRGG